MAYDVAIAEKVSRRAAGNREVTNGDGWTSEPLEGQGTLLTCDSWKRDQRPERVDPIGGHFDYPLVTGWSETNGALGCFVEECANKGLIFARVKKSAEVIENKGEIFALLLQKVTKSEEEERVLFHGLLDELGAISKRNAEGWGLGMVGR